LRHPGRLHKMPDPSRILLIQPMQGEYTRKAIFQPGVELPLNLTSLAAYLERAGIPCTLLDLRTVASPEQALQEALERERPAWAGISAFSSEIVPAARIAGEIKKVRPGIPVVIGGYHATAEPEETLRGCTDFDFLVHGEGERTALELARCFQNGKPVHAVKGAAWRRGDEVVINPARALIRDLDTLPFTHRDKLDLSRYLPSPGTGNFLRLPSTGIMASRGCPYNCYYCSKGVWGTRIRFRSVDNVLAEIEHCMERHGIRDFRFYDDALPLPVWDLKGFCGRLLERNLSISWNCYSRVDLVDPDTLGLMRRAGCYHIKYGIEFGTERSLKNANKKTTLDQAREAVRLTKQAGIECKGNFILGIPGETGEDCRETVRFAVELSPDLAAFYPFYPAPGSVYGKRIKNDPDFAATLIPEAERERLAREAYRLFYLRPAYVLQRLQRMARHPGREIRMLGSAARMMGSFALRRTVARWAGGRGPGRGD
jgi:anaerobic magnesium-protoporphyrin IX monomethyl ester cyclase